MTVKPLSEFEKDIPQLSHALTDAETKALFDGLTPGYQREWARYVYGAAAQATQDKHFAEMKIILAAGYKSKRAYGSRKNK